MIRALALAALVLASSSCGKKPPDATPEGALDEFLRACEETPHDPKAPARAFALLAPASREALRLRAIRATAITGKGALPEQMIAPLWTPIRFEIDHTTTKMIDASKATVEVFGPDHATQRVVVPMEREGEAWRVIVVIPPIEPSTVPAQN